MDSVRSTSNCFSQFSLAARAAREEVLSLTLKNGRFPHGFEIPQSGIMEVNMEQYRIIKIAEHRELLLPGALWFHQKWGIPEEAYRESMEACVEGASPVPQWYLVLAGEKIIAGLGVIENDFHDRKDLTPNVCAVYVEEEYRCQGIAGRMLRFVCEDFKEKGVDTLYLVTDHTSFYERYGWEFLCMVQGDGEEEMTRMYVHR